MKPSKVYANIDALEATALEQFNNAMEQEFVTRGALMADAHTGYSLPIGAVIETRDVILPSWVGYDIGCGMCAVPTSFKLADVKRNAKAIFEEIYSRIPTGFNVNQHPVGEGSRDGLTREALSETGQEAFDKRRGFRGLGSLGGGNHFIEVGYGQKGKVWVIIHSGSRGVGHGIAQAFMRIASPTGKASEGHHYLEISSPDGQAYVNDVMWATKFALANRKEMMLRVVEVMDGIIGGNGHWKELINRNHNHVEPKDGAWIHRKGATHADLGMMGVIPGNMRDGSFIVEGLGNEESLCSSSHGAGRVMSRKKARETGSLPSFEAEMAGVTAKVGLETIDEAPFAYKNIFEVMSLQEDLVSTVNYIRPIINVKA